MVNASERPDTDSFLAPPAALGVLIAVLAVANLTRSTVVPPAWHLVFNVSIALVALLVALAAGLSTTDLGTASDRVTAGTRLGSLAFLAIAAVVVGAGLAGLFSDGRVDVSVGDMLLRTLVLIPIGTVLVEELVFRGVLHGLLVRATSARGALAAGALLFGLWHVFPAWRGGGVETDLADVGSAGIVAATFATTSVAGAALVWLRVRSGSLMAPALAHLATNSVTFAVAWALH